MSKQSQPWVQIDLYKDLSSCKMDTMATKPLRPEREADPLPQVVGGFQTVLADPPWRFSNRTGKVAPEHRRLDRYSTMSLDAIKAIPVSTVVARNAHLYLWVPNALLLDGLAVMEAWGFRYISNIVWAKRRKDGGPDGRGVGFYFRNVTELLLFGVHGSMRTLAPARSQVNMIETRKREHSRKPDEQYTLIEDCSPGPFLELFARHKRPGWTVWGDESGDEVAPRGVVHKGSCSDHGQEASFAVYKRRQRSRAWPINRLFDSARARSSCCRGNTDASTRTSFRKCVLKGRKAII
jgi:N6-adenosine-specific RNA methylase IME4